jgi:hypothetical protein
MYRIYDTRPMSPEQVETYVRKEGAGCLTQQQAFALPVARDPKTSR